jgi:hypothetical protein
MMTEIFIAPAKKHFNHPVINKNTAFDGEKYLAKEKRYFNPQDRLNCLESNPFRFKEKRTFKKISDERKTEIISEFEERLYTKLRSEIIKDLAAEYKLNQATIQRIVKNADDKTDSKENRKAPK